MNIFLLLDDIKRCNEDWSISKMDLKNNLEISELLRQCADLPSHILIDDVVNMSRKFPVPFPINTVRFEELCRRRPLDDLKKNTASTYPVIHEKVLFLCAQFLIYKRFYGSVIEKKLYENMSIPELIDRILKKRAITFMTSRDKYKLITGHNRSDGWEAIGTPQQKPPLLLSNCLSYDEMKLSAMVYVSGHTEFINNGSRKNVGVVQGNNIERNGVIIGLIGARLAREFRMDYEDLLITPAQNCPENGYGVGARSADGDVQLAKFKWRQLWAEFYHVDSKTYCDLTKDMTSQSWANRYIRLRLKEAIFDNEVFSKRLAIPFDCTLLEANERGKVLQKKVFLNMVGIGLGVWKVSPHQIDVFVLTMLDRIESLLKNNMLSNISDVNLAYIDPSKDVEAMFKLKSVRGVQKLQIPNLTDPNGGINVTLEKREPSTKLREEHANKLLVTTYAWDSNAHPGNEFWLGKLSSSGDPAAACSTQVAELHNAHINNAVAANNLRVIGTYGVLPLQLYCKKLLQDTT